MGAMLTLIIMTIARDSGTNTPTGTFGLIVFFFALLISALIVLAIPLFHILGQWAGYRVLKGDNYRYPLIGKLVEKRLSKSYGVQESAPASGSGPLNSTKEIS